VNPERNADQNYLGFHLSPVRMAIFKSKSNNKCWQGYSEIETLYTAGGNVNQYNHYRKQYGDSSKS
jgi:hypothetical protein